MTAPSPAAATRIVYYAFPNAKIQGGQKMILRHVETLRDLGFNAIYWTTKATTLPTWLSHDVPVEYSTPIRRGDVVVLPEDAVNSIATVAGLDHPVVIFCQNQFILAAFALDALDRFPASRSPTIMAVGQGQAATLGRLYPRARVEVVPCFADERLFRPAAEKSSAIAYMPKKRGLEPKIIRGFLRKLHPRHADRPWLEIDGKPEAEVAATLAGAELYLSLSRFESVGMSTLEAMASGCVCAGFTGVGGQDYATPANGFWAPDDDCEAAADVVLTGGPPLRRLREAGEETARAWSYARFRDALEETWMRLAPGARLKDGPLD